jgi:polyisoprenoid-binding protein YceI
MTTITTPGITTPGITTPSVAADLPGYRPGTWVIDPVHSEIGFSVRHLMVSKTRGRFTSFSGELSTGNDPLDSKVDVSIELASIDTGNADRDAHVRSADFFDVEQFPTMTYRSTGVRRDGDRFLVDGELSLHGVTKSVPLAVQVNGFAADTPFGDSRVGFSATAEVNRDDFGISFNAALESGGVLVANKIQVSLEVEAILQDS